MPKVSIIMPVYNTSKYLHRSMDALVNQTWNDIEIIAVNDGSTDNSQEILEEYASRYPDKVRVIVKENGGQATARNLGIRESKGDYIGFADSDDYVDVTMFEKMVHLAEKSDADMVECHFHYIEEKADGTTVELAPRGNVRDYGSQKNMFIDPQVSPWNKMYRREVLLHEDMIFPEGVIFEDTSFYIKSIAYVKKQAYLDEHLVYYFLRENSTMTSKTNRNNKVDHIFTVLQDILDFYKKHGFYEEYQTELEYFYSKIMLCSNLSRIGRVEDSVKRKELIGKTFDLLQERFPDYKNNPYYGGKMKLYIRMVNRNNADLCGRLLGKILKG